MPALEGDGVWDFRRPFGAESEELNGFHGLR